MEILGLYCKFLRSREITCTYLHYFQAITVETKLHGYEVVKFPAWLTHLGQVGKLDPSAVRTYWEVSPLHSADS